MYLTLGLTETKEQLGMEEKYNNTRVTLCDKLYNNSATFLSLKLTWFILRKKFVFFPFPLSDMNLNNRGWGGGGGNPKRPSWVGTFHHVALG